MEDHETITRRVQNLRAEYERTGFTNELGPRGRAAFDRVMGRIQGKIPALNRKGSLDLERDAVMAVLIEHEQELGLLRRDVVPTTEQEGRVAALEHANRILQQRLNTLEAHHGLAPRRVLRLEANELDRLGQRRLGQR